MMPILHVLDRGEIWGLSKLLLLSPSSLVYVRNICDLITAVTCVVSDVSGFARLFYFYFFILMSYQIKIVWDCDDDDDDDNGMV